MTTLEKNSAQTKNQRVLVETNKEVAEMGYDLFYNKALFITPEGIKGAERQK